MRIGVLSDTRLPTLPTGGHGLGRVAWDIAAGLAQRGHEVMLHVGKDSALGIGFKTLVWYGIEETRRAEHLAFDASDVNNIDVWIDLSHFHDLSKFRPDWPVVNWIVDTECEWQPPRAVVGNRWQQKGFPDARIVPLGIDVDAIPFYDTPGMGRFSRDPYLAFCHKIHANKGFDIALDVAQRAGLPVHFAGDNMVGAELDHYHGELTDDALLYEFVGSAVGLLSPCRLDAGGRVNLEAAACGTPVVCLDWTGTREHVAHCVSGFVCANADEMVEAVADLPLLDRARCREWAADTHGIGQMLEKLEGLCQAAIDGEMW